MSEPIKVVDLVVVVKPTTCCGQTKAVGKIFRVVGFADSVQPTCCGVRRRALSAMWDGHWRTEVVRLKRIPPLGELEGEKRDEEITA